MQSAPPEISVIVPAFNEEKSIGKCLVQLSKGLSESKLRYEIIVVDDGSNDSTFDELTKIARELDALKVHRHDSNKGKCEALKTGFKNSLGEVVCILDADLEYAPSDMLQLFAKLTSEKVSVVYGSRFRKECEGMRLSHRIGNAMLTLATNILFGTKLTDVMTGDKAFRREALEKIDINSKCFEFEIEVTSKLAAKGYKIVEIPISYTRRKEGRSKISWFDGVECLIQLFRYKLVCR